MMGQPKAGRRDKRCPGISKESMRLEGRAGAKLKRPQLRSCFLKSRNSAACQEDYGIPPWLTGNRPGTPRKATDKLLGVKEV